MRLNNKEFKVVVDEIYKRVSQPTIDKNLKVEESILIKDSVTEDYEIFQFSDYYCLIFRNSRVN